jgi:hypothetical protein
MKAVITKSQYNRIKNFINETKEIKKDEVLGEKKKLTKKQLDAFDVDNDGDIESDDLADLRAMKKITKEELKGGQKKLDKNKNNKIDADDFKLLRKQKQMDEGSDCGCGDSEDYNDTRYMFFSNLEQMMRQARMLLQMDEDMLEDLLNNGHDWAADHIAEAKNNMDQVFDFIMGETHGEGEDESWHNEKEMVYEGMINEDYLELRSVAKKLYSFLKSKGIRVRLSRGQTSIDLFQMRNRTDLPVWDKGISASLKSDGKFINKSERYRQYYAKEISKDEFMKPDNFKPEIIIDEHILRGDDFSFKIYFLRPTKEETTLGVFRTRKVFDEEKMKNYQKIVLDFLKQFNNVNIKIDTRIIGSDTSTVYNVSAIEPSMNEGMSLKKKAFVSKELKHHLDKNIPLYESEYKSGSLKHIELLKEVKELYSKGVIALNETDEFIVNEFDPKPVKIKGIGEVYLGLIQEEYESDEQLLSEAVYQGRKVKLGKAFLTPDGPKKRSVYVRNDKGNVVKVNFGDPNMRIKKNIPARRKSFRARHNCANPGPRWKSRYWSCRFW